MGIFQFLASWFGWTKKPTSVGSPSEAAAYGDAVAVPRGARDAVANPTATEDEDDLDLDAAIGAALDKTGGPSTGSASGGNANDGAAAGELFASIAANYTRPVKNFIVELQSGATSKEWLEICLPVTNTIIEGAEALELTEVARRVVEFREALSLARACEGREIEGDSRELILSCYEDLIETLPETFTLDAQDQRRESIIIHSLLRQIPEVGHVTFDKLYAAGVGTLEALFLANGRDLSVTSGVSLALCERICEKVQQHRERLESSSADDAGFDPRSRLVELVKELRRHQDVFEEVAEVDANHPELAAEKRTSLRNRQACALQINVVLAEMGVVDLVEEINKLAIERRIHRLEAFLFSTAAGDVGKVAQGASEAEIQPVGR